MSLRKHAINFMRQIFIRTSSDVNKKSEIYAGLYASKIYSVPGSKFAEKKIETASQRKTTRKKERNQEKS